MDRDKLWFILHQEFTHRCLYKILYFMESHSFIQSEWREYLPNPYTLPFMSVRTKEAKRRKGSSLRGHQK